MSEPNAAFFWQQTAGKEGNGGGDPKEAEDGTPQATQAAIDLAAELGIDLNTITGTGLHGKITKPDVEAAAA